MKDVNLRVAGKAIIINDKNQILLVREAAYDEGTNTNKWGVPGGRINNDEPFYDGFRREIYEEVGLENVEIGAPLTVADFFPVIKGVQNHIVALFIMCKFAGGGVQLSEEHDAFVWLSESDFDKYEIMDDEIEPIRLAFEMLKSNKI